MEIRFLGGCKEVGKVSIEVHTGVETFLLDYGVNVQTGEFPELSTINFNAVVISHAHLDHSGMLPYLYRSGYRGPLYGDPVTFELISILLRDYLKLQKRLGLEKKFLIEDLRRMERNERYMRSNETQEFSLSSITFYHAGHIPGSVMPLVETKGKRVLFTGDVKFIDTELMKGADTSMDSVDVLISESTYSYMNHPDRKELENDFKRTVLETVESGGVCIIPAFAIGRTQELLIILGELDIPLYMDGMGIRATEAVLRHPSSIRNYRKLQEAFSKARKIRGWKERERIIEKPCAILTTAGMLNGGPVVYYMERLYDREDCSGY